MKIIEGIKSGSPEWHAFRSKHITATDIPVIMGVSPYKTPAQLFEEKVYGINVTQLSDNLIAKARAIETELLNKYEKDYSVVLRRDVLATDDEGTFSATFDGLDGNFPIECKYVSKDKFDAISQGEMLPEHMWQMAAQVFVANTDSGFYLFSDGLRYGGRHIVVDPSMIEKLLEAGIAFREMINSGTPPEPTDRDWVNAEDSELAVLKELVIERKSIEDRIDELKETLSERYKEASRIRGRGVTLTRQVAKGNINYKAVPELEGVDLERYRGKARVSVVLRLQGEKL
jgi:putative phage-type endonuclease